ncbi:MAG: hypothetical protein E6929_03385 [Clostridium sp.]|nr:hypothetical protein [Clostridium sp.]
MNKKLFLKLGVLLLSLSLVSCGQKNNSLGENNSSKSSTSKSVSSTESSGEQSIKNTSPSIENAVESKQEDEDVQKYIQQEMPTDTQEGAAENGVFIVAGGTNIVQDVCEYYLDSLDVTPRIQPSIITETYSSYNVKTEDNIYIDVILNIKNLKNEAKVADDIITAKIKINSDEYTCFSVAEIADGSDLENYASINPLETRKIHYVAEVPIIEATGEIEIILTVNGKDFSNNFNLEGMMP